MVMGARKTKSSAETFKNSSSLSSRMESSITSSSGQIVTTDSSSGSLAVKGTKSIVAVAIGQDYIVIVFLRHNSCKFPYLLLSTQQNCS